MNQPIHDDEPDTSEPVVRALLAAECPQWSTAPIDYLQTSGTDNAMWRIRLDGDSDVVMRLPRRPEAAAMVGQELSVLRRVAQSELQAIVETPSVCHAGSPLAAFPHEWSILGWIDGTDAWSSRDDLVARSVPAQPSESMASDLARAVSSIATITGVDVRRRSPGRRGGPLGPLIEQLHRWLDDPTWNAAERINISAVTRLTEQARELIDEPVVERFVHGDLIPGNLLVDEGRLTAIIDWGGAGWGDPAQDLAPAWAVLTAQERPAFREMVGADDAAWIRGRTFELEHAIGGVLYYEPRGHALGDVMARTLDRILADPG